MARHLETACRRRNGEGDDDEIEPCLLTMMMRNMGLPADDNDCQSSNECLPLGLTDKDEAFKFRSSDSDHDDDGIKKKRNKNLAIS